MNNNKEILLVLSFCFFLLANSFSQKCPNSYVKGDQMINESKDGTVCFTRIPDLNVEDNIFHTKYILKTEGNTETYNLDFYFNKDNNTIEINYLNNQTGVPYKKNIKFDPEGSTLVFKDYASNDPMINKNELYDILFTIYSPLKPYVTLNHFRLLDNEAVLFKLLELDEVQLEYHIKLAKAYIKKSKMPDVNSDILAKEKHTAEVENLFRGMRNYRDSIIEQINEKNQVIINGQPMEPNLELMSDFTAQLNTLFINYYKTIFPYKNHNSKIEFVFICDSQGKIENAKDIRSINSEQLTWFEDSFNYNILPIIQAGSYKSMKITRSNNNYLNDFLLKFKDRFLSLNADDNETKQYQLIKDSILEELAKFQEGEVNLPTKYIYTIKYQSIVKSEEWIYKVNRDGEETLGPKDVNISDNLKNLFRNKKIIKRKKSNYNIKRCDVLINNEVVGQDLMEDVI